MGEFYLTNSASTREQFLVFAAEIMEMHPYVMWEWVYGKPRTGKQNSALYVFCRLLAEELNKRGITFQQFFREGYEVPWSKEIVKDNIWTPMQQAVAEKGSSTELTTVQVQEIYEHINRKTSEHGIHVPWPEKKA